MSFLNIMLLGGAAAAAIPVLLHLLNRRRFQVVRWGAMMFLEDILRTNRRRIRIEQILLLLVRAGIPILLALAMARPLLTGVQALVRSAPSSLVLLFDNSYSMDAGAGTRTALAAAREESAALVARPPRGSEAAVVGLAGPLPAVEEPSSDLVHLQRGLEDAAGGFGLARVAPALQSAAALFATRLHEADRSLVIVSDFQRASWGAPTAEERRRACDTLAALPIAPRIILYPVPAADVDNLSVGDLELSRGMVGVGQPLLIRATVHNHSRRAFGEVRVHGRADGVELETTSITLAAGEERQVLFKHRFATPGSHVLEVAVDEDPLRADNVARASLPVLDRIPVLLVSGDPNPQPLRGETAYLEIALQPFARAGAARLTDLLSARMVPEQQFKPEQLADARVVVLANVGRLERPMVEALAEFVRNGGGLLIFPGDRSDPAWYNEQLGGADGLLPGRLAGPLKAGDNGRAAASFAAQPFTHPALALFNDPRKATLAGGQVRAWFTFTAPEGGEDPVLARFDNGDAFLAERRVGHGRVILCTIPCDAEWSNLPRRPCYVTLAQELVLHLAAQVYPPRNVELGARLTAFVAAPAGEARAVLTDPDGVAHDVAVVRRGLRGVAEWTETSKPGLYTLAAPGGEIVHFAVRAPPAESDLERLTSAELDALAAELKATVVRSREEYAELEQKRRFGRELWRPILFAVLGLLLGEVALQRWFARRSA